VYDQFYNGEPELAKVGRIVNAAQWKRIMSTLSSTKGHIILGDGHDESQLYIAPTVVRDVLEDDVLVQAELFGPVLPVIRCTDMAHAKEIMRSVSVQALGFYILSEDLEEANDMVNTVQAGSAAINDVMAQIAPTSLPFGGIGHSGHGAYRGKAGIDTFSHKLSLVTVPTSAEFETMIEWRYPYSESDETLNFIRENLQAELP
jgi:acyl-CoA reductase-like NAD-dependent aldehyde dehydrogenase